MTLEDLDETLPYGLHDALIRTMSHDYEAASVKLEVEILVGLPGDAPPDRSRYRNGEVLFHRTLFCAVDVPGSARSLPHPGSIWFKFWRMEPGALMEKLTPLLTPETLCYSLYILEWESQIHIVAADVSFSWSDSDEAAVKV